LKSTVADDLLDFHCLVLSLLFDWSQIFCNDCALMERGVLGGDDFSPAGGARAEENKRSECEEYAGGFHLE